MSLAGERSWKPVGGVSATVLREARLQAHWAAQLVAAAGDGLVDKRPDGGHTSMEWSEELEALEGCPATRGAKIRVALRLPDLRLLLRNETGRSFDGFSLDGRTLLEGLAWLRDRTESAGLALREYVMPSHPVASGGRVSLDGEALVELAAWFGNADVVLRRIAAVEPNAGPVCCWPHHFDLATRIPLGAGRDGEAQSVGVGLTPGDDYYSAPYWYVTPWPYPDSRSKLPGLTGGGWHTDDWVGAVMTAQETRVAADARAHVEDFLQSAIFACRMILRP